MAWGLIPTHGVAKAQRFHPWSIQIHPYTFSTQTSTLVNPGSITYNIVGSAPNRQVVISYNDVMEYGSYDPYGYDPYDPLRL